VSRKNLLRADKTIESAHESAGEEESSDEDIEDETYIPSPRAPHHRKGKKKNLKGVMTMVMMKMKALMWRKSIHSTISAWGHPPSHNPRILLEGKDELQGKD
jgi:hypothetical protein